MKIDDNFLKENSKLLLGLENELDFLVKLHKSNKFPRVLMLSGKKGIGKFTLVHHFLNYIFDGKNYDISNKMINENTEIYNKIVNNIHPNIVVFNGDDYKSIKIDEIRLLKKNISQTTLSKKERFIILNDIELFNNNCLNALLKVIEEPSSHNYFIIINNQQKSVIKTILSRSLNVSLRLTNEDRLKIIETLVKKFNLDVAIDFKNLNLTPGNFLIFNELCKKFNINIDDDLITNIKKSLDFYKKDKDVIIINLIFFLTDYYFHQLHLKNKLDLNIIVDQKDYVVKNIFKFKTFNLNQNSFLNSLSEKLSYG